MAGHLHGRLALGHRGTGEANGASDFPEVQLTMCAEGCWEAVSQAVGAPSWSVLGQSTMHGVSPGNQERQWGGPGWVVGGILTVGGWGNWPERAVLVTVVPRPGPSGGCE